LLGCGRWTRRFFRYRWRTLCECGNSMGYIRWCRIGWSTRRR